MNKQRLCPTCNDEDLDIILVSPTRAYTLCTKDESAGRDYFTPDVKLIDNIKVKAGICINCHHDIYLCTEPTIHFHHMDDGCGESGYKTDCACAKPERQK